MGEGGSVLFELDELYNINTLARYIFTCTYILYLHGSVLLCVVSVRVPVREAML